MSLYDRDYIREREPRRGGYGSGGLSGLRMLSVNTWLIAICVAVFVIDGFLPMRDVETGRRLMLVPNIPAEMVEMGPSQQYQYIPIQEKLPNGKVVQRHVQARALVEKGTTTTVGWAEVYRMRCLESIFHFSTKLGFLGFEWWRFVGFQFLHANVSHLFFNMLGLFFFGPMVEQYLGSKRYLAFYLLCGMCGAFLYLLLNLTGYIAMLQFGAVRIPGLLFSDPSTPLVGASAGIFGVLMAGAYIAPRTVVLLMFVIPMQLRTVAYALLALALFNLMAGGHNAGGEAGHIGGALAGYYFIRRPYHLHGFLDLLGRADPTSHHYRKKGRGGAAKRIAEVDRILDKIRMDGVQSLTESEKRTLQQASRRG
ncbi:MAG: rhomboid family intramembrane serine protease [Phycisphaerales bacterium]|nr:rhomboid family intramembrane serine protease [Phycisphaerales bacterium]MCI0629524.1 rhomboid family intramembrane serine protease [Phycisphaerales bacterium]MCI0674274.1 rhomboid family intramembrane serine protease [Phycisphaerales bacterium]